MSVRRRGATTIAMLLMTLGSRSPRAAEPVAATQPTDACLSWTRTLPPQQQYPLRLLSAQDGGALVIGSWTGAVDAPPVKENLRPTVAAFDRCGRNRYTVSLGSWHNEITAASLDAGGDLYVAGTYYYHGDAHAWLTRIAGATGQVLWSRKYTAEHSAFDSVYPSGQGVVALADIGVFLRLGGQEYRSPPDERGDMLVPGVKLLVLFAHDGTVRYVEEVDRFYGRLIPGLDRVYLGAAWNIEPTAIEARALDGRRLWYRETERHSKIVPDPSGRLVQLLSQYVDCGTIWYSSPLKAVQKVTIDPEGEIVSMLPLSGVGEVSPELAPAPIAASSPWSRPVVLDSPTMVDGAGRLIQLDEGSRFTVYDESGKIVARGIVPGTKIDPKDRRGQVAWAADGAAYFTYTTGDDTPEFHIIKWVPEGITDVPQNKPQRCEKPGRPKKRRH
jgi:hypothetical protein